MSPGADEGGGDTPDDGGGTNRDPDEGADGSSADGGAGGSSTGGSADGPDTNRGAGGSGTDEGTDAPSDGEVVEAAAAAAEDLVFSRIHRNDVEDYDVTVTFEEGILEVDVYVEAPDADADAEQVADDAALAASGAVDDLFADDGV